MADAIFLLGHGPLKELTATAYDSELLLQRLLAEHPRLMAGDQIDADSPRRWMLVTREMPVAAEDQGGGRWSLDHLFLDQDGIPTLVEVKRGTDTRVRREVVGQMLDYAANAVVHWPVEEINSRFEARCVENKIDPTVELRQLLAPDEEPKEFWLKVKTNLQAGRVRLIFVADVIPTELRRIVEFLNTQMDPAEVLALEIKQYTGSGLQTLVPRVIGRTAEAERKKGAVTSERRQWDEQSFFTSIEVHNSGAVADVARRIWQWAESQGRIRYGRGAQIGSYHVDVYSHGVPNSICAVYTSGVIEFHFQYLRNSVTFAQEQKRRELLSRLNAIENVDLPDNAIERRPNFPLSTLVPPECLRQLVEVLDWAVAEINGAGARTE